MPQNPASIRERFRFQSAALGPHAEPLHVLRFSGTEGFSRLFSFDISLATRIAELDADAVLTNPAALCILRSGGDAKVIQFLDSGLEWLVGLPCAFLCVSVLGLQNIALVLLITQLEQLVRLILGMRRVRSYRWTNDLTQLVA